MTNEQKLSKALQDFKTKYPSATSGDLQTFIIGWQEAVKNCFIKSFNEHQENLNISDVNSSLYEFTMTNKNGKITKSTIPCDDWLEANRVKTELLKSKNLIKVDFEKVYTMD